MNSVTSYAFPCTITQQSSLLLCLATSAPFNSDIVDGSQSWDDAVLVENDCRTQAQGKSWCGGGADLRREDSMEVVNMARWIKTVAVNI